MNRPVPRLSAGPVLDKRVPARQLSRDVMSFTFENIRTISVFTALFLVAAVAGVYVQSPEYSAEGRVVVLSKRVGSPNAADLPINDFDRYSAPTLQDLETEINILRSQRVLSATLDAMTAGDVHALLDSAGLAQSDFTSQSEMLQSLTVKIDDRLNVHAIPGANVVSVALTWKNGEQAAALVNTLIATYLKERSVLSRNLALKSDLSEQEKFLSDKLTALTDQRSALSLVYQIDNAETARDLNAKALLREQEKLSALSDEKAKILRSVEMMENHLAGWRKGKGALQSYSPIGIQDDVVAAAEKKLLDAYDAYTAASIRFRPDSPPVRTAFEIYSGYRNNFITLIESRIPQMTSSAALIADAITDTRKTLDSLQAESARIEDFASQALDLERELEKTKTAQLEYAGRLDTVAAAGDSQSRPMSDVQVLQNALPPSEPSSLGSLAIIALGIGAGLAFGILFAIGTRLASPTLRTPDDIMRELDLPALGYTVQRDQP